MRSFSILDVNSSVMYKNEPNSQPLGTNLTDDFKLKQNFEMKKRHSSKKYSNNVQNHVSGKLPKETINDEKLLQPKSIIVSSMKRQSISHLQNCAGYDEKVEESISPQITQLATKEPEEQTICKLGNDKYVNRFEIYYMFLLFVGDIILKYMLYDIMLM